MWYLHPVASGYLQTLKPIMMSFLPDVYLYSQPCTARVSIPMLAYSLIENRYGRNIHSYLALMMSKSIATGLS